MGAPMYFDIPQFRGDSSNLLQLGQDAGTALDGGLKAYTSQTGDSPLGQRISLLTGSIKEGLDGVPPQLTNDASAQDSRTNEALNGIDSQDRANAGMFQPEGSTPGAPGMAGSGVPGELDGESIDKEAKDKAQDMLGGDQAQQMMQQLLQMGIQMGTQLPQQLSQQLGQITQQLGQVVSKAGEQVGQMASKAAEAATKAATDAATSDLGGLGGDFGGGLGGGGGGGMDPGMTTPAGIETPVTPMTTSSALQPNGLTPPGGAAASSAGSRMPMMPMMPMHGMHGNKGEGGEGTKRDPIIFPESKLYEAPEGTEQTFGANPEIESEEPPFGTSST
ncbi:hypothetical protein MycrhDRAFT_5634 [Mycolicibacterium rhodesiae JS60]|nr:hypothetical protein MycrhDRAFT_5634 [Mycolicibacterium rhodesiae JS60]